MADLGIKIIAPFYDIAGISQVARETALALSGIGIQVNIHDIPNFSKVKAFLSNDVSNKLKVLQNTPLQKHVTLHMYPVETIRQIDDTAIANISWSVYETNKIPYIWKIILNHDLLKEVWTASEFNRETYINSRVKSEKLSVVNQGVNTSIYHPGIEPLDNIRQDGNFYFLYVSALKHCKGFDVLLKAFFDEFKNDSKVKLIFKADMHSGNYDAEKNHIKNLIKSMKGNSNAEVLCLCDNLNEDFMARLYSTADCFVLPTRGEGWGLGNIQSMACGIPVITTNCSAQTTYCNKENSLLIDAKLEKIENLEWLLNVPYQQEHEWFEPNYKQLREQMRYAYKNPSKLKELGLKAHDDVQKYSWENVAMNIVEKISRYA